MWTKQHKNSKLRYAVAPLGAVAMLAYFSFHSMNGTLGSNSSERYEAQLNSLSIELASLQASRAELEKRTTLLRDGSLERDLIDEEARKALGLTRTNELVLLHSSN